MEIKLKEHENSYAILYIFVQEQDYLPALNKEVKKYASTISIKGFRTGKVPLSLIKRKYGIEIKVSVITKLVNEQVVAYLEKNALTTLIPPLPKERPTIQNFYEQKEFSFTFETCLEPQIIPKIDKDFRVSGHGLEILDKDIDAYLEQQTTIHQRNIVVEQIEKGDLVKVKFNHPTLNARPEGTIPTNQLTEATFQLFKGRSPHDSIIIDPNTAFASKESFKHIIDLSAKALEKLAGDLQLTILEINRSIPATIDQALFDKILGKESVQDEQVAREKIKEIIRKTHQQLVESLLKSAIYDKLLADYAPDLPVAFLEKVYKTQSKKEISDEEVEKIRPNLIRSLQWGVIFGKIKSINNIVLQDAEIQAGARTQVKAMLSQMGMNDVNDSTADIFSQQILNDKERKDQFMEKITQNAEEKKVFDFIIANITVEETIITIDELREKTKTADNAI